VDAASDLQIIDELVPGALSDLLGNDDEAEGDGGDDLDLAQLGVLPDADLQPHEELRAQRCPEHIADLMTKDAVKAVAQLKEAVQLALACVAVGERLLDLLSVLGGTDHHLEVVQHVSDDVQLVGCVRLVALGLLR
jgi:hypothetical protein